MEGAGLRARSRHEEAGEIRECVFGGVLQRGIVGGESVPEEVNEPKQ